MLQDALPKITAETALLISEGRRVIESGNLVLLIITPWGGFRFEDGYQVTANGAVKLNPSPLEPLAS